MPSSHSVLSDSGFSEDRRRFLFQLAGAATIAATSSLSIQNVQAAKTPQLAPEYYLDTKTRKARKKAQYKLRQGAAKAAYKSPMLPLAVNGDEDSFANRISNFTKSLPHGDDGLVDPAAYDALLHACTVGTPESFEHVPGGAARLTNPLGGYAFTMEGADPYDVFMPPPPSFASAETASEMIECYWHALLRDVPYSDYETHPLAIEACRELSRLIAFRGPRQGSMVTPQTLFRGNWGGCNAGPYLSQFVLKDFLFGETYMQQKYRTVEPGSDYMTTRAQWLARQRGERPTQDPLYAPTPRYVINGRDFGMLVHNDFPYMLPLTAVLVLLGLDAPSNAGDPYRTLSRQESFVSFGAPHVAESVARVSTLALRTAWRYKWTLHRRCRPEEFAARVHDRIISGADYPIHPDILGSRALAEVYSRWGSYVLPQVYPEGSPCHPAYPSGHATFVGAGVTMVKAFFDENYVIPNPVMPSPDGQSLIPYNGPPLTVGGELNKLAANVAISRNFAGVHWRSDATEGNLLGERVAIELLRELKACYMEPATTVGFHTFDGTFITI